MQSSDLNVYSQSDTFTLEKKLGTLRILGAIIRWAEINAPQPPLEKSCHSRAGENPRIYGGERKVQLIMFTYLYPLQARINNPLQSTKKGVESATNIDIQQNPNPPPEKFKNTLFK